MLDKILVAVDGSGHSLKAVDYAAAIAASMKSELVILFVLKNQELPKGLRDYAEIEHILGGNKEILKKVAKDLVSEAESRAAKKGAENIVTEIETGPVARTIVARAKHNKADMIVIGKRGLGNIEATLRGGISHRVELLSKCPVLSVR